MGMNPNSNPCRQCWKGDSTCLASEYLLLYVSASKMYDSFVSSFVQVKYVKGSNGTLIEGEGKGRSKRSIRFGRGFDSVDNGWYHLVSQAAREHAERKSLFLFGSFRWSDHEASFAFCLHRFKIAVHRVYNPASFLPSFLSPH